MTDTHTDDFNDSLDDLIGGATKAKQLQDHTPDWYRNQKPAEHIEVCQACRGTGRFISYSGRALGPCFKCKGQGKKVFKTSAADRAHARQQNQDRKARRGEEARQAFKAAHPAAYEWLLANVERNEFATSLWHKLATYGDLTDGQLAAVTKGIARDAERKASAQARVDNAKAIDMSKIELAFEKARSNAKALGALGIRWLKLRLDTFEFLDMPAKGQWNAAVRVTEGEKKLGRIEAGKFVRSFACDDPTEARIIAAAADPQSAAVAYGKKYGVCAICGRTLENEESIKRGIGPICADKYGW